MISRINRPAFRPSRLRRVFGRIDHIGVAVADLDAALDLYDRVYGLELVHRETVAEQGVEAALLDVGENHVELLAPARRRHAGRAGSWPSGARACTTSPTSVDGHRGRRSPLRAAGLRLIDETPRTGIRGSRVAFLHPAASGGVLTEIVATRGGRTLTRRGLRQPSSRPSASRAARCCRLRLSQEQLDELRAALQGGGTRWHEVEAADGAVLAGPRPGRLPAHESDEQRVGF